MPVAYKGLAFSYEYLKTIEDCAKPIFALETLYNFS